MKLAFTTLGCPKWDLDTILSRAREYSYDGVDFRCCAGEMDIWKLPEFSTRLGATAARIRDAGLEVPCLSTSAHLLSADEASRGKSFANLEAFLGIGEALGAGMVRVFAGRNHGRPYEKAVADAAATLDDMARLAAPHGIRIAVETHDDWIATDKLAAVLNAATEPNIGALWDINHPFCMAGETPEQSWRNFGRYVVYTHVKDSRRGPDAKREHRLVGEGDVPIAEIVALLRREGYDGWLTYEWEKKWAPEIAEPEVAFPHYVRYMRPLIR